jgi:hypothetical protein
VEVLQEKQERERERERLHSCHEENKTSCWILISKNGMRIEVRALDRCGLLPKSACSNLSSSLALHLGPLQSHLLWQIGSAIQNHFLIELEKKLDMSSHLLGHHKINAQSLHQQVHIPRPFLSNCGLGIVRLMSLSTCWHPP